MANAQAAYGRTQLLTAADVAVWYAVDTANGKRAQRLQARLAQAGAGFFSSESSNIRREAFRLAMQVLWCVTPKLQGSLLSDYIKALEAVKCAVQELESLFGSLVSTYGHSPALEVIKKSLVEAIDSTRAAEDSVRKYRQHSSARLCSACFVVLPDECQYKCRVCLRMFRMLAVVMKMLADCRVLTSQEWSVINHSIRSFAHLATTQR